MILLNKRQKIVQDAFLNNEEAVIRRLKQVYNQSLKDIEQKAKALQDQINTLDSLANMVEDADEKAKLLSMKQAKVYQKQYQDALKKQIGSILDNMQVEEFKTVSEYLNKCYEEGFLGAMYDLQGQGIPLVIPLDQEAVVRAVQLDSKISEGLYSRLGEDVTLLKKKIIAQVSRGIATGMTFQQVAQQLAGYTNIGYNNAVRIARTEGHRIQVQSAMDACYKAKDKGANIVKSWNSTLDGRTRPSHQKVDGEIRELDEPFSNNLMFPGDPSGGAGEVVNCRCALLQRARWNLDSEFSKYDNFSGEHKEFENDAAYQGFKKDYFSKENTQYMKYVKELEQRYKTKKFDKILAEMTDEEYKHFKKLEKARPTFEGMYKGQNIVKIKAADYDKFKEEYLKLLGNNVKIERVENEISKQLDKIGVEYNQVMPHTQEITEEEMINALSGGDKTQGSCASVGLAYCGQKCGFNVLDFRDGKSRSFFANKLNLRDISNLKGLKTLTQTARSSVTSGNKLLKLVEKGKEYYLVSGRHAAIVRRTLDDTLQYLELQSAKKSGWTNFDGNPRYTLKWRFGETKAVIVDDESFMIEVDSFKDCKEFQDILGYINTAEKEQRKGIHGSIK